MGGRLARTCFFALLLWAAGALVLLLCSFNTTPLNPFYGGDGHFFALMGRMTSQGYLPFVDVYDQKGPLVFYLNALGWLILPGKGGVFLLQSLFLAVGLGLVYRLCRLWGTVRQSLVGLALFAAVYAACLWGGNMTEEYSLPLCLLPAYLILRALKQGGILSVTPRPLMLAGVCLGALAFLRLNNAAPLCGVLLGLVFCAKGAKQWVRLFVLAYSAVAGLVAACVAVCVFFEAHGALGDMLMGTFIHNWHYATGHTTDRGWLDTLIVVMHASPALLLAWLMSRRGGGAAPVPPADRALFCFAAFSLLVPALGPASSHYFIMAAPAVALLFVYFAAKTQGGRMVHAAMAVLLLMPFAWDAAHLAAGFRRYNILQDYQADIEAARRIASCIPEAERDKVLAYDVHASIYTYGGLTPCHRYFTMQGEMSRYNPDIAPAIDRLMQTAPPQWLILSHDAPPDHPAMQHALQSGRYSLIHSEPDTLRLDLYRLSTQRIED